MTRHEFGRAILGCFGAAGVAASTDKPDEVVQEIKPGGTYVVQARHPLSAEMFEKLPAHFEALGKRLGVRFIVTDCTLDIYDAARPVQYHKCERGDG
ncbi:MAG TPA: hypothetical protein VFO27_14590 [Bryobacteraceae bacterium]|nr:hypothetical protein [Bryobacteraceae bacterium]